MKNFREMNDAEKREAKRFGLEWPFTLRDLDKKRKELELSGYKLLEMYLDENKTFIDYLERLQDRAKNEMCYCDEGGIEYYKLDALHAVIGNIIKEYKWYHGGSK
jgi:hypothetical protein